MAILGGSANPIATSLNITTRPFSIGMWVLFPAASTLRTVWSWSNTSVTNDYLSVRTTAGNLWGLVARGGGTENSVTGGTVAANSWYYIVARFISATNDRLDILNPDGSQTSLQRTTSRTPTTGSKQITFGALVTSGGTSESASEAIAEYWTAKTNIQPDGLALSSSLLRQLAYKGPLSVPEVRSNIFTYRRLRSTSAVVGTIPTTSYQYPGDVDEWYVNRHVPADAYLDVFTSSVLLQLYPHPPVAHDLVTPSAYAAMTLA